MKSAITLLLCFLAAPAAMAAETPWQEVMPDVSIRLIATNAITERDTTWVAIEFDMSDTVKTYWRVPGESGIPPKFDFAGSSGLGTFEVAWPYPKREETEHYLDHAYYGYTLLPIEIELTGDKPSLALNVLLGICSDICVPVSADFALELEPGQPDRSNVVRMQQARSRVPLPWNGDPLVGDVWLSEHDGSIMVDLESKAFPMESAIADIEGRPLLFGVPETGEHDGTIRFPLLGKSNVPLSESETVHITFMGEDGPYEVVRPLSGPF